MTQLQIFAGQRLPRPVGVDWFRQLKPAKLLNLKPGNLVWYISDDHIECAMVTEPSVRLDTHTKPRLHGIQVFCSSRTRIWAPCLILDKHPSIFYMITDREAAYEYYEGLKGTVEEKPLKLVSSG
jgi:hypothetical protein